MAYEIPGYKLGTLKAATALSQYTFVAATPGSAPTVSTATTAASGSAPARLLGVIQNAPTTGAACEIVNDGVSKVTASGAIVAGQAVAVDTGGKAKALVVGSGAAGVGVALTATTADGQTTTVLLGSVIA